MKIIEKMQLKLKYQLKKMVFYSPNIRKMENCEQKTTKGNQKVNYGVEA